MTSLLVFFGLLYGKVTVPFTLVSTSNDYGSKKLRMISPVKRSHKSLCLCFESRYGFLDRFCSIGLLIHYRHDIVDFIGDIINFRFNV